ncbi:zinc ribbon domain-containing protein [Candidatus Pacearchaeota archaeon]|nr:zinc ribbon domain-containing protein [Candidatus Pacearchaeota archaeon]
MFNKKKCKNCGEKISNSYNFCPYCRVPLIDSFDDEDFGLLGRNDSMEEVKLPLGFNHLFNSLIKNMNTQFKELESHNAKQDQKKSEVKKGGISISISTSGNRPPEIKVTSFGNIPKFKEREKQIAKKANSIKLPLSEKKFSGMPKKEPETNIRRLSNKVVYEINMPGVKSMEDVSIIQLENSIEIKAFAKDKVFHKIIPINLPISDYNLSKGKLVLELDAR